MNMIDMIKSLIYIKKEYCKMCGVRVGPKEGKEYLDGLYCDDCAKIRKQERVKK